MFEIRRLPTEDDTRTPEILHVLSVQRRHRFRNPVARLHALHGIRARTDSGCIQYRLAPAHSHARWCAAGTWRRSFPREAFHDRCPYGAEEEPFHGARGHEVVFRT